MQAFQVHVTEVVYGKPVEGAEPEPELRPHGQPRVVKARGRDMAPRAAREALRAAGYYVRAVSFRPDGHLVAVVQATPPVPGRIDGWVFQGDPVAVRTGATGGTRSGRSGRPERRTRPTARP